MPSLPRLQDSPGGATGPNGPHPPRIRRGIILAGEAAMPWDRSRRSVLGAVLVAGGAAGACFGVIEGGGDALVAVAVAAAGGLALGVGAAVLLARRAQLQPPLQADPLPAAVAHRMSSPLSALRTNLEWLRDALEA